VRIGISVIWPDHISFVQGFCFMCASLSIFHEEWRLV